MRKHLLNVAAFLLFVALVIMAQAPDGAAPAFKGPDAVAANLVTTACASCHSLDRVRNKVADKDGWTATVNRMKGAGANLTEEQVQKLDVASQRERTYPYWHQLGFRERNPIPTTYYD